MQLALCKVNFPFASAQSESDPIYLVKYSVLTTSDWAKVKLTGLSPFASNTTIVLGVDAPLLRYSYTSGETWIAKKQYDATPVLLEVSVLTLKGGEDGVISIDSGGMGDTVVDVYLYSDTWIRLFSITHSGSRGSYNYTVDYHQLYNTPSGSAKIETVPMSLRKAVYAFYYPWYGDQKGPSGVMNHWSSNDPHTPLIGTYDSNDENVIEAQIEMAKAAGIDGFIVSWWGVGTWEDQVLPVILRVAEKLNFKITIYYEADRSKNQSTSDVANELTYVTQKYSNTPAFLKANGMPVIFFYGTDAWDRSPSFWTEAVSLLENKVGPTYLVGGMDQKYAEAFDGFHWYWKLNNEEAGNNFDSYKNNMKLGLKRINWNQAMGFIISGKILPIQEKLLAFTVMPGADKRWYQNDLYLDRADGKTYEDFWQTATSKDTDIVLITSWNEWHEGAEIEPSLEYGYKYLNLTRQSTSNYKGSNQPLQLSKLEIYIEIDKVLRTGERTAFISLTNVSPNPTLGVNLSLSLSGGLSLQSMRYSGFYIYTDEASSREYHIIIPLLKSYETLTFNAKLSSSPGMGELKASATGYSPSTIQAQSYIDERIQIISDRILVNLSSDYPRLEVGSNAQIIVTAKYEYDGQPIVGATYLNDTLTKTYVGKCTYSTSSVSDKLYGLTTFTTNTFTVVFDRITASDSIQSLNLGNITPSITLSYESDGQPVDKAKVTINNVLATESIPGTFQTTLITWSPYAKLNVRIEAPGFTSQDIALSEYAIGNIALELTIAVILLTLLALLIKRKRNLVSSVFSPR